MSWMHGEENGRPIGYGVEAECDEPECRTRIDRGLAYRCGGVESLHSNAFGCGLYFCKTHQTGEPGLCARCAPGRDHVIDEIEEFHLDVNEGKARANTGGSR